MQPTPTVSKSHAPGMGLRKIFAKTKQGAAICECSANLEESKHFFCSQFDTPHQTQDEWTKERQSNIAEAKCEL